MRILILHNRYQVAGGEDAVVAAEMRLLAARGHDVTLIETDNDGIVGTAAKLRAMVGTPYNPARRRWAAEQVRRTRADVVHIHNVFPRLSPAVLDGAADAGAGVVQTLHNYRTVCANGLLLRDGMVCEDCLGGAGLPAIRHRCYRQSVAGSAAVVAMQQVSRLFASWNRPGRRLIALTQFARGKLVAGGLPEHRIVVKPNFIDCPKRDAATTHRAGMLFVGRLSVEKGIDTFLAAARLLPGIAFTAIGDGPDEARLRRDAPPNVTFEGALPNAVVRARMMTAAALVIPSIWYEGFPMTLLEAYSAGTPVIASRIGSLSELVADGDSGRLFTPGDPISLAVAIGDMLADPAGMVEMGQGGRDRVATLYDPLTNAAALEAVYATVTGEVLAA